MSYEEWFEELRRIFALMGYQEPPQDCAGWVEYFEEGNTPAQAIIEDMAYADIDAESALS